MASNKFDLYSNKLVKYLFMFKQAERQNPICAKCLWLLFSYRNYSHLTRTNVGWKSCCLCNLSLSKYMSTHLWASWDWLSITHTQTYTHAGSLWETTHAYLHNHTENKSFGHGGSLLLHSVGGVQLLLEDLIPTCLRFLPHLFSAMLRERHFCFPGMTVMWRVLLLWVCVCICLPATARGALLVSRSDALPQVFKTSYVCSNCWYTNLWLVLFYVWCVGDEYMHCLWNHLWL